MVSFARLWEEIDKGNNPLMDSGDDSKTIQAIRAGLSLRPQDEGPSFWDDMISLCSNPDGLAELLGVRPEHVSRWAQRIRDSLDEVKKKDQRNTPEEEKEILPTGENGAVTDQNMGQFAKAK